LTFLLDKMRGAPEDLYGRKALHIVAQMAYPAVVAFLAEHYGAEEATEHLRDLGSRICKKLMRVYKPKKKKFGPLIKEFFNTCWEDKKIKVKAVEKNKLKRPTKFLIYDKDCGLCPKEEELEPIENLNFCSAISGFLETMLQELTAKNYPIGFKYDKNVTFKVDTLQSRGSGKKKCIHEIKVFY